MDRSWSANSQPTHIHTNSEWFASERKHKNVSYQVTSNTQVIQQLPGTVSSGRGGVQCVCLVFVLTNKHKGHTHASIHPSIHPPIHPSTHPSIHDWFRSDSSLFLSQYVTIPHYYHAVCPSETYAGEDLEQGNEQKAKKIQAHAHARNNNNTPLPAPPHA